MREREREKSGFVGIPEWFCSDALSTCHWCDNCGDVVIACGGKSGKPQALFLCGRESERARSLYGCCTDRQKAFIASVDALTALM